MIGITLDFTSLRRDLSEKSFSVVLSPLADCRYILVSASAIQKSAKSGRKHSRNP